MEEKDTCFLCTGKAESNKDYVACSKCQKGQMKDNIVVYCVKYEQTDKLPAISVQDGKNLYPNGDYFIMPADQTEKVFGFKVEAGGSIALIDMEYNKIMDAYRQQMQEQQQ